MPSCTSIRHVTAIVSTARPQMPAATRTHLAGPFDARKSDGRERVAGDKGGLLEADGRRRKPVSQPVRDQPETDQQQRHPSHERSHQNGPSEAVEMPVLLRRIRLQPGASRKAAAARHERPSSLSAPPCQRRRVAQERPARCQARPMAFETITAASSRWTARSARQDDFGIAMP
jgi:hypothetical protein